LPLVSLNSFSELSTAIAGLLCVWDVGAGYPRPAHLLLPGRQQPERTVETVDHV
jgi:hypothetical protein